VLPAAFVARGELPQLLLQGDVVHGQLGDLVPPLLVLHLPQARQAAQAGQNGQDW